MMLFGLRFERRDARRLRAVEAQIRNGEMGGYAANVFAQAAIAAETGEPLELHCTGPMEAVEMAAAYVRIAGVWPVIEELQPYRS